MKILYSDIKMDNDLKSLKFAFDKMITVLDGINNVSSDESINFITLRGYKNEFIGWLELIDFTPVSFDIYVADTLTTR